MAKNTRPSMHSADDDDNDALHRFESNPKYQEWQAEMREKRASPPHRPESKPSQFFGGLIGTLIAVGLLMVLFFL